MKVCFPVISNKGLSSEISPHFGSSPIFLIVDDQTCQIQEISNTNEHHAHGMCQPLSVLAGHAINAMVVSGIGMGALAKLNAAGIRVYRSENPSIRETIEAIKAGILVEMGMDSACQGHTCH